MKGWCVLVKLFIIRVNAIGLIPRLQLVSILSRVVQLKNELFAQLNISTSSWDFSSGALCGVEGRAGHIIFHHLFCFYVHYYITEPVVEPSTSQALSPSLTPSPSSTTSTLPTMTPTSPSITTTLQPTVDPPGDEDMTVCRPACSVEYCSETETRKKRICSGMG